MDLSKTYTDNPTIQTNLLSGLHPYGSTHPYPCDALGDTLRSLCGILNALVACSDEQTGDFLIPDKQIAAVIDVAFDLAKKAEKHSEEWEEHQKYLWATIEKRVATGTTTQQENSIFPAGAQ